MTTETIHTCSYECERPECIRAQRDELVARLTAETSNARGEWVLVPREPTPEMVQASNEISCRAEGEEHWAAMLAAAPQPPSAPDYPITATCRVCDCDYRCVPIPAKCGACGADLPPSAPVGVDAPGSRAWMAEVCRAAALSLAAHGVRNDQLSKVADWIAQQPAAVDGAAAIRAFEEHFEASAEDPSLEGELELWLTAWRKALSAQHQEPTT